MKKTNVNIYTAFAKYYDYVLKDIDYNDWFSFLKSVMIKYNPSAKNILEIGCGTGKFGAKFSSNGYNIIGIDNSVEMLKIAKRRAKNNFKIFCANATSFHLKKKQDFIFCIHDMVNYILDKKNILKMFKCIKKTMHKDSIFLFDITTEYNILENFENNRTNYYYKGCSIKWDNKYNFETKIISSTLKFTTNENETLSETHNQKIYTINEMKSIIKKAGLELLAIYGDSTFYPVAQTSVMINFVTRKKRCILYSLFH